MDNHYGWAGLLIVVSGAEGILEAWPEGSEWTVAR